MGCNAMVQDSPLLRNALTAPRRHQNTAGGSRTSGLSKPKHCAHRFSAANTRSASAEAESILAAQHTRLHPGCNSAEMLYYDLLCLEIRTATQSVFLQPSGPGSEMNTPLFSPHFRLEVTSCLFFFSSSFPLHRWFH